MEKLCAEIFALCFVFYQNHFNQLFWEDIKIVLMVIKAYLFHSLVSFLSSVLVKMQYKLDLGEDKYAMP